MNISIGNFDARQRHRSWYQTILQRLFFRHPHYLLMLYILSDSAAGEIFLRMMLIIIELIFFDRLFSIIGTFFQNRDQIETNFSHFPKKSLLETTDKNRDRIVITVIPFPT